MLNLLIILLAVLVLAVLLYFEKAENPNAVLPSKTLLSCLFILAVLVQAHPHRAYFILLLIGLIFCLGGDILLALPQEKAFLFGLVSFLLGHILYVFAFYSIAQTNQWTWIGAVLCLVLSAGIYLWLRPNLGSMNVPVLLYVVVITVMMTGAFTVLGDGRLNLPGRIFVFLGALSFYFSDIFVARNRFLKDEFLNRLIGLPMYYLGQFLLAFSVSKIAPV
jgi:uncharacterized membrane protein YhhN